MRLERHLDELASDTMHKALGLDERPRAILRPTSDPKFGSYQINGAMPLAKQRKTNPRELAAPIAEAMQAHPEIARAEVAGPGFVNLHLDPAWIGAVLTESLTQSKLGAEEAAETETIVVDYSSPNIAKQMHVGHLRSTIIGHAIVQLLRFQGHRVIADNHLGDWGTQYGWLIVGMREYGDEQALQDDPVAELERVYKTARERGKEDEDFAAEARAELAKLQAGDPDNRAIWERLVKVTRQSLDEMYARLGVSFDEWLGESAYHDRLPEVVETLKSKGIAREDEGAVCVFFHDLEGALAEKVPKKLRKQKQPFIVQKKDGAYLYSTTDIATVWHRREQWGADRSLYVVGSPQALHFQQLFAVMRMLGEEMDFEHIGFGQILGTDGKVMRTSQGESVSLASLLDEAESVARTKIDEQRDAGVLRIPEADVEQAAKAIGIGAIKYNDLQKNRSTDYRFDLDAMVQFSGNAGPYLQYQFTRTRSIFRTGDIDWDAFEGTIAPEHEREVVLAGKLAAFPDVIERAASTYNPHFLCEHLYEIAQAFSGFFKDCSVLQSEGATRTSRLALTKLTGRQLETGLGLLGIEVIDRM